MIEWVPSEILPPSDRVFAKESKASGGKLAPRFGALFADASALFLQDAKPVGMLTEISTKDFAKVFQGEGRNAAENPLLKIFPLAERLGLFALTLGQALSTRIERLFSSNDFALGYVLDAIASTAADETVRLLENRFMAHPGGAMRRDLTVLAYSPGYCGWHLSGQRKLFEALEPKQIGIALSDCCLMTPLKSVTGVLVEGNREVHAFRPEYEFCPVCKTRSCQERMSHLS